MAIRWQATSVPGVPWLVARNLKWTRHVQAGQNGAELTCLREQASANVFIFSLVRCWQCSFLAMPPRHNWLEHMWALHFFISSDQQHNHSSHDIYHIIISIQISNDAHIRTVDSCMEDGLHVSLRNSGKHTALKPSCLHVPRCIFSDVCPASCAAHIAETCFV